MLFRPSALPGTTQPLTQKADLIVEAFNEIGCDAVNVGEYDLYAGRAYLEEKAREAQFPFLSANLRDAATGELAFQPYTITEKADLTIGIFGLITDRFKLKDPSLVAEDPVTAAQRVVNELRPKCDLLIALTYMGVMDDQRVAQQVAGIDMIIGGRSGAVLSQPLVINGTLIMQAQNRGRYLGQLELVLGESPLRLYKSIATDIPDGATRYTNTIMPMSDSIASDAHIQQMVDTYKQSTAEREQARPTPRAPQAAVRYMGHEACKDCHTPQHEFWKKTLHAHAYATLVSKSDEYNPECVGCHTTGYNKPGGFPQPNMVTYARDLRDVQCEMCHSVGFTHVQLPRRNTITRRPPATTCQTCHTADTHPDFDYVTAILKIACPPNVPR